MQIESALWILVAWCFSIWTPHAFPAVYGLKGLKGAVYQNLYFINNKYHSMFIVSLD